ncbi:MAG: hypothetical protein HBSIN02_06690 [Bacteroidia bacterium]|nr:MAG: hypothetical protein HBSIN02_06690 [Bacteroidia bacterium]
MKTRFFALPVLALFVLASFGPAQQKQAATQEKKMSQETQMTKETKSEQKKETAKKGTVKKS